MLYHPARLAQTEPPQGISSMSRYTLLIINGAILTACAVFIYPGRTTVLTALLLLVPLLDRAWQLPNWNDQKSNPNITLGLLACYSLLITLDPNELYLALSLLLLIALPEEWFFRAYLMVRLKSLFKDYNASNLVAAWSSNITSSALFTLVHLPTQGLFGLSVFFPSLVFGWIYQKSNSLIIIILLHAISNLVFLLYLEKLIDI